MLISCTVRSRHFWWQISEWWDPWLAPYPFLLLLPAVCVPPSQTAWQVRRLRNTPLRCLHGHLLFYLRPCSTVTFKETVSDHSNQGNNSPSLSPYVLHSIYYHTTQYYIWLSLLSTTSTRMELTEAETCSDLNLHTYTEIWVNGFS